MRQKPRSIHWIWISRLFLLTHALLHIIRTLHRPKCQALARARWVRDRMTELLPVDYFRVVLTVPDFLNPIALRNKSVFYNILFRATKETLQQAELNPRNLGARIGFLAILHINRSAHQTIALFLIPHGPNISGL